MTTPTPPLDPFSRRARMIPATAAASMHDGDTVRLETDSGYGGRMEPWIRLDGVTMPELKDPGGPDMRATLMAWFAAADPALTWPFWVEATQTKVREPGQRQTFARYVGTVWRFDGARKVGPSLNTVLTAYAARHPEWGGGRGA